MSTFITWIAMLFLLAGLAAYIFAAATVAEQCSQIGIALFGLAMLFTRARSPRA